MYMSLFRRSRRPIYTIIHRLILILRLILIIISIILIIRGDEGGQDSESSIHEFFFTFLRDVFLLALPFNYLRPRR
jgi:hypothetical protein